MRIVSRIKSQINKVMPRASFARNVGILAGGTVIAQGLMVLSLPILTRLYSPEAFGLLAVYIAILNILTVISCFRYNIAIPLPEKDEDALSILYVSIFATSIVCLICSVPVILAPDLTARLFGRPEIMPYLWMIPVGVFIASAYNSLQYWASRKKRFALVSQTRMIRAIGGVGTQIGFSLINPTPFGLIFGHMIYGGLGIIGILKSLIKNDSHLLKYISLKGIALQAKIYRRYPFYSTPEALLGTASIEISMIMISSFAGGQEAGIVFLAMRVMGMPMALIGNSVSQVYLAEAAARERDGTLKDFTIRTMWSMFKIGAPILIIVGLFSPLAFPLIFGEEWSNSGWLVAWMTPWFLLQFVVGPVSVVMQVKGRFRLSIALNLFGFLIRTVAIWVAILINQKYVGEVFAIAGMVYCLLYICAIIRCINQPSNLN